MANNVDIKALGQLVCVGIPADGLTQSFKSFIEGYFPGNFIIFQRNTSEGPRGLRTLVQEIGAFLRGLGLPPPFFLVDQEGHTVSRLGPPYWQSLLDPEEVARSRDPVATVREQARKAAEMLRYVGINVNLAPVLDLRGKGAEHVLAKRTFGQAPELVSELGASYISTLQAHGVMAVAKHFPGIGAVGKDPHKDLAESGYTKREQMFAMYPFDKAIQVGVFGVMTSHVLFPHLDPHEIATFSRHICTDILRQRMGFEGLVFTDDLLMKGIGVDMGEGAKRAILAGHDVLLFCHDLEKTIEALEYLKGELKRDETFRRRVLQGRGSIVEKKRRLLKWQD